MQSHEGKENAIAHLKNVKKQEKIVSISQVLQMKICQNSNYVDFGTSLPGYVLEESLIISNLSSVPQTVKSTVLCFDDELNELDEYIFSIRMDKNYEYNESQVCVVGANKSVQLFVALKSPNLKSEKIIQGIVQVRVNETGLVSGILEKEIQACIKIPKIICFKELYSTEYRQQVIKLAMKMNNNGRADCKIPLKNLMSFTVKVEFELIQDKKSGDEYDFSVNPEFGVLQGNTMAMVVILGKKNELKGGSQASEGVKHLLISQLDKIMGCRKRKQEKMKVERNVILLVKVVNSTIILSFPTIIEIY